MLELADDLPGGELILSGSGGTRDADESSYLCDLPAQLTVEKKVGHDTLASVVVSSRLQKGICRLQDGEMSWRPQTRRDS